MNCPRHLIKAVLASARHSQQWTNRLHRKTAFMPVCVRAQALWHCCSCEMLVEVWKEKASVYSAIGSWYSAIEHSNFQFNDVVKVGCLCSSRSEEKIESVKNFDSRLSTRDRVHQLFLDHITVHIEEEFSCVTFSQCRYYTHRPIQTMCQLATAIRNYIVYLSQQSSSLLVVKDETWV